MTSFSRAPSEPLRQPLRIPGGWVVEHNELRQLEPAVLAEDSRFWSYLTEDLLQLRNARRDVLVDAGWYPDGDPGGGFRAVLLQGQDWENPLQVCNTRSLSDLVVQIEEWLARPQP